ncbi:AbrB/MazE/SpoVT family DNA-binding domain-containing protein [Rickettsiella endosymbiont of Aleochara curtula]|uniref:AbrB/MazE/SpoVT family DNA-binding domain-containing protein n=1 Tax=Rickettsiella endosymbiont of Aleochara curtula TaxID=3077936 RepID=UPI00313EE7DE
MSTLATTRLSSKGQIVIPEEIREQMGLHTGDRFIVIAEEGVVILKTIFPPEQSEYHSLIKKTRRAVKRAGLTKASVSAAIKKARKK